MWAEIAWTVQKLFVDLFKLEITIGGPILGGFGENDPLRSFCRSCEPQKAPPCARPRRLTYRSSKSAKPFLQAAWPRNEQNKKKIKTNRRLMCWPVVGQTPLIGWWWVLALEEFPERNELCWVWFWSVKGFRICRGSILAYCHSLSDPSLQLC
jgi:hypothetical protein